MKQSTIKITQNQRKKKEITYKWKRKWRNKKEIKEKKQKESQKEIIKITDIIYQKIKNKKEFNLPFLKI